MKKYTAIFLFIFLVTVIFIYFSDSKSSISNQAEIKSISNSYQDKAGTRLEEISTDDATVTHLDLYKNKYYNDLPQITDIFELSEADIHDTPEIVLNAARIISQIENDGQSNDKHRPAVLSFLKACAEDNKVLTSVRALCLSKLYRLMPKWKRVIVIESKKISEEVESLALEVI